jgi:hypothetical protein
VATGTHQGPLDLGGYGLLKPTGAIGKLRLRQIIEFRDGRIAYSGLSFDVQDIVQQLTVVSVPKLLEHLKRVHQLGNHLDVILRGLLGMFLAGPARVARERRAAHGDRQNIALDKV